MTSHSQQLIAHAACLLDFGNDQQGATGKLRQAIEAARQTRNLIDEVQARAFLGELLLETDCQREAIEQFEHVLNLARGGSVDLDSIEQELRTARQHLSRSVGLE
ncbi:MAG TPA: hypothetical protein VF701_00950 [Thermoanaerobaculia bacterium]